MNAASPGMGVPQVLKMTLMLVLLAVAVWVLYIIRQTLLPFGIAFVLSYILSPLVDRMESRGLQRMLGVLVIYASMVVLLVVLSVTFIPILVDGMDDMKVRIMGERADWSCAAFTVGEQEVHVTRAESTHPDFAVLALPLTLGSGARDTLDIQFSPSNSDARASIVRLYGYAGDETEREVLLGRLYVSANKSGPASHVASSLDEAAISGMVAWPDSVYHFGQVSPGFLADLKQQLRVHQPAWQEMIPMLEGVDIAEEFSQRTRVWLTDLLKKTPALVGSLISGITFLVIVPIVSFFFLGEGRAIKRAFIEMIPNRYFEMVLNLLYRIDLQLGGYIRGLVMSVIIISLLSITGLRLIGLRDYLVVGTLAGVSNVIPYLGPIIGILAGLVAAVLQYSDMSSALPVVGVFLVVQIVDNIFVQPIVVGRSVNLHPLVVIFVVLVGNQLFGAVGMLLAVPFTAVMKVAAQTVYEGLRSYSIT